MASALRVCQPWENATHFLCPRCEEIVSNQEGGTDSPVCADCWSEITASGEQEVPSEWRWPNEGGRSLPLEASEGLTTGPAWWAAAVLGRNLCQACEADVAELLINLPGNWLPTRVCLDCMYGPAGFEQAGWREICHACGGDGDPTGEGLFTCESCGGEGVVA